MWALFFLSIFNVFANPRISSTYVDVGKPIKYFLYPGRSGLIDFPCSIISATPGPGKDIELKVGTTNAKEVHIFLRSGASEPTNMIVRCQDAVFVFDVIPSTQKHQDYLQISGYFGGPSIEGLSLKNNSSSKSKETESNQNKDSLQASKSIKDPKDLDQIAKVLNKSLRK
jgi:hypothetical protein